MTGNLVADVGNAAGDEHGRPRARSVPRSHEAVFIEASLLAGLVKSRLIRRDLDNGSKISPPQVA